MRAALLSTIAATLALWGVALWLWPQLPERIPMHFDGTGLPDRIVERTPTNWFLLPALGTVLTLLLSGLLPWLLTYLARKRPTMINLPDRQRFLELSADERALCLVPMLVTLRVAAFEMSILFAFMLVGIERVAVQAWSRLPALPAVIAVAVMVATVVAGALLCMRVTRRMVVAHSD